MLFRRKSSRDRNTREQERIATLAGVEAYIRGHCDVVSDHSFEGDRSVTIFRRRDNNERFAATKNIGCRSVNVDRAGRIDILNVRVEPRLVAELQEREGFRPAWRMNRNKWITILLDGTVPIDEIHSYIDMGYQVARRTDGRR